MPTDFQYLKGKRFDKSYCVNNVLPYFSVVDVSPEPTWQPESEQVTQVQTLIDQVLADTAASKGFILYFVLYGSVNLLLLSFMQQLFLYANAA